MNKMLKGSIVLGLSMLLLTGCQQEDISSNYDKYKPDTSTSSYDNSYDYDSSDDEEDVDDDSLEEDLDKDLEEEYDYPNDNGYEYDEKVEEATNMIQELADEVCTNFITDINVDEDKVTLDLTYIDVDISDMDESEVTEFCDYIGLCDTIDTLCDTVQDTYADIANKDMNVTVTVYDCNYREMYSTIRYSFIY